MLSVKFKLGHVKLKRGEVNMQSEYLDRKWLMHEMILGLHVVPKVPVVIRKQTRKDSVRKPIYKITNMFAKSFKKQIGVFISSRTTL